MRDVSIKYKENIEKTLVELRQALERGRNAVARAEASDEEKAKLMAYIKSFDARFMDLEQQLVDVYRLFIIKNELIDTYGKKLNEAYEEIARLNVDNRGLEDSLFCDIQNVKPDVEGKE